MMDLSEINILFKKEFKEEKILKSKSEKYFDFLKMDKNKCPKSTYEKTSY